MPTKKSPVKKTAAKTKGKAVASKSFSKPQQQMAASVGPLLMIIGVLAMLCLFLGFYITMTT